MIAIIIERAAGTVATLLRASSSIKSDYYQAETLKKMSKRYAVTAQTRPYYVAALASISSDYYKQEVLSFLNSDEPLDAATTGVLQRRSAERGSTEKHFAVAALLVR